MNHKHKHSQAREFAMQFLYQCECEKLYYFSKARFREFAHNFKVPASIYSFTEALAERSLNQKDEADKKIEAVSRHWSVMRMPSIDRCVLRMACSEIEINGTPRKVIINEAIELAKKFGTKDSGSFVNGVLDRV